MRSLRDIIFPEFSDGSGGIGSGLGEPGYEGRTFAGPRLGWTPSPAAFNPEFNDGQGGGTLYGGQDMEPSIGRGETSTAVGLLAIAIGESATLPDDTDVTTDPFAEEVVVYPGISDAGADTGGSVYVDTIDIDGIRHNRFADISGFLYVVPADSNGDGSTWTWSTESGVTSPGSRQPNQSLPITPTATLAETSTDTPTDSAVQDAAAPEATPEYTGPSIGPISREAVNQAKNDEVLLYDLPPAQTGYTAEDYFGYALIYGLKQSVYKPIKSWALDERTQYLDANQHVKTSSIRRDRSAELAIAFGTIASFFLPVPGAVKADVATAEGAGTLRVTVSNGKPVLQGVSTSTTAAEGTGTLADLPTTAQRATWATAEGVPAVKSGYGYPGYEGNAAADLWRYSNEAGLPLRPNGFFDPILGAEGAYASTHAEIKIIFQNPHVQFVQVTKTPCIGCRGWIGEIVMQRDLPIVVLGPKGFWYFTPNAVFFP